MTRDLKIGGSHTIIQYANRSFYILSSCLDNSLFWGKSKRVRSFYNRRKRENEERSWLKEKWNRTSVGFIKGVTQTRMRLFPYQDVKVDES